MATNFFNPSLLLLFLDPGSEIWDPGSRMGKNQVPGSGITSRIRNTEKRKGFGSGSVLVTNGCGSGRPKNIRIRIRNTGANFYFLEFLYGKVY
jgi:hypothetical protein